MDRFVMEREISEKADKFWLRTDKGYFEKVREVLKDNELCHI